MNWWTEIHSEHIWREEALQNISATVITKMQRWLNLSWMSSFPLRSALFLSPAGRNLPTLLRTSTKYDPLQRKPVSARSDRHLWVFPNFRHYSTCFCSVCWPRLLFIMSQAKLCFRQASTWRIAAPELNCQLAWARTVLCLLQRQWSTLEEICVPFKLLASYLLSRWSQWHSTCFLNLIQTPKFACL